MPVAGGGDGGKHVACLRGADGPGRRADVKRVTTRFALRGVGWRSTQHEGRRRRCSPRRQGGLPVEGNWGLRVTG